MNICMMLNGSYPPDIRVKKEVNTLLEGGHNLTLLCRGSDKEPSQETQNGMKVVRLHRRNRTEKASWLASGLTNLAIGIYPRWVRALRREFRDGVDAVHVHDLPLVRTALVATAGRNIPVVADLHENYPEAVRQWRRHREADSHTTMLRQKVTQAAMPISRLKRFERSCITRADRIITVCKEAKYHYISDCGANPEHIHKISNTVELDQFDSYLRGSQANAIESSDFGGEVHDSLPRMPNGWVAVYVGRLGIHRGLETVIEALTHLDNPSGDPIHLLIVGPENNDDADRLRAYARELGVADRVSFTGWVGFEDVPKYMAASDAGLVPHSATSHTETTVPHKLFQYMAASRPVLVTDIAPLKRIVEKTKAGLVIPADDQIAMAKAIHELYKQPSRGQALGRNGRRAVEKRYHWRKDGGQLLELYQTLGSEQY